MASQMQDSMGSVFAHSQPDQTTVAAAAIKAKVIFPSIKSSDSGSKSKPPVKHLECYCRKERRPLSLCTSSYWTLCCSTFRSCTEEAPCASGPICIAATYDPKNMRPGPGHSVPEIYIISTRRSREYRKKLAGGGVLARQASITLVGKVSFLRLHTTFSTITATTSEHELATLTCITLSSSKTREG